MPGLTVTEKQHWRDRVARRIDARIERIAAADANLIDRVKREARRRALQSLGLADLQAELEQLERDEQALDRRKTQVTRAMLAQVRGVPAGDLGDHYIYRADSEVESAVARRQAVHEDELLAEDDAGREILRLRQEKENLLDTVWLATGSAQIKALWAKVAELLGDEATRLEREALAIAPVSDA